VYRIFYIVPESPTAVPTVGFAGWLASSFDGHFAYTPPTLQNDAQQTAIGSSMLFVTPDRMDRLPVGSWLSQITQHLHVEPPAQLSPILTAKSVETTVSSCFSGPWDGQR
jgi:hypothetical protein